MNARQRLRVVRVDPSGDDHRKPSTVTPLVRSIALSILIGALSAAVAWRIWIHQSAPTASRPGVVATEAPRSADHTSRSTAEQQNQPIVLPGRASAISSDGPVPSTSGRSTTADGSKRGSMSVPAARSTQSRGPNVAVAPLEDTPLLHPIELPPPVEWSALDLGTTVDPAHVPSVPPATGASAAPATTTARETQADSVMRALNRYAQALSDMDVRQVMRLWPTVDQRALADAFQTLDKYRVVINACGFDVDRADTVAATCQATVEFVPKVGSRVSRLASQQWRFTMTRAGDDWQIESANALAQR